MKHPDWLRKIVREINDGYRQTKIDQLFKAVPAPQVFVAVGRVVGRGFSFSTADWKNEKNEKMALAA